MPYTPFAFIITSDDSIIKRIRKSKAFNIKTKADIENEYNAKKKGKKHLSPFDLIPGAESGSVNARESYYELLCQMASKDNYDFAEKLFNDFPLSKTWRIIANNTAISKSQEI